MLRQNLGTLEECKAMKYAKQVRGSNEELSTNLHLTSRVYSLDDVTTYSSSTHVPKYTAEGHVS